MKVLNFRGSALTALRAFPESARREAGYQLDKGQHGLEPADWKRMPTVGRGGQEIRECDEAGAFREIYFAKFADAVDVQHCFQKETQHTRKADLDTAAQRYADLVKELGK